MSELMVWRRCCGNGKERWLHGSAQTSDYRGSGRRYRLQLGQLLLEAAVERLGAWQTTTQLLTLGHLSIQLCSDRLDAISFLAELPLQLRTVLPRLQQLRHQTWTFSNQQQRHLTNHEYTNIRQTLVTQVATTTTVFLQPA